MDEELPLHRQSDESHFGSLLMLPLTSGWAQRRYFPPPSIFSLLKANWQRRVLASSGDLEFGMFDDAALALEEIAPEDKNRDDPPLHQFHRGEAVGPMRGLGRSVCGYQWL